MLTIQSLVASLAGRPDLARIVRDFAPPPRFSDRRFDNYAPRHPSQGVAVARLQDLTARLVRDPSPALLGRWHYRGRAKRGVYLDGGFGVGKTHLLAATWHATAAPAAYLSFDELMYFIGIAGLGGAAAALVRYRLVAVDEWELDDPGNLKLAVALLRRLIQGRTHVAVTSNTPPLDLGLGRFSQKDFRAEIEELADAFEVIRVEGDDYRRRSFEPDPGAHHFLPTTTFRSLARGSSSSTVRGRFDELLAGLRQLHPIRFRELAGRVNGFLVEDVCAIGNLPDALRWVHFIDSVYDAGIPLAATGEIALADLFDRGAMAGPFAKKFARCLSRMEEMLGEAERRMGHGSIEHRIELI